MTRPGAVAGGRRAAEAVARPLPDPQFWRDRRVLLTGHTGFKGAWLALWLERLGARVTGFALDPPTEPSLFALAGLERGVAGDVRDAAAVRAAARAARPEVVLHLAGQALVRGGWADPAATYATNVLGTVHVLQATGDARVRVVVTSDKVYAPGPLAHAEGDPLGGTDPYSASKACADLAASQHGAATVRAGNVVGGGDWAPGRLVPDVLRARGAVALRNPGAVRPWQHVLSPLHGYLLLAERLSEEPALAGPWNFGPPDGDARTVRAVVERLGARWRADPDAAPPETAVLRLDATKARERLGWAPRWDLDEALVRVRGWHDAVTRGVDARAVSLAQIAAYESAPRRVGEQSPDPAAA